MDWKAQIRTALEPTPDDDVLEELAQHAAATYAAARAEGADAAEAEQRVAQQIAAWAANPALLRRRPKRDVAIEPPAGSASPLAAIGQDTRYAWRLLRRQPAYAALVVATMALGIAATTVLGSVTYGVLLKPLPWADAPRLVRLYETRQGSTRRFRPMMTNGTFREWHDHPAALEAMGAWSTERVVLAGQRSAERITITDVTPSLLEMLRAVPAIGRTFNPDDAEPGRAPVLLLSHGFWQQQFGGRPDVLGQTVRLDANTYTVVGVLPASFAFPDRDTRAWAPFYVEPVDHSGQRRILDLHVPGDRTAAARRHARPGRRRRDRARPRAAGSRRRLDGRLRQQRSGRSHGGAAAAGAHRRRQAGDPHPACGSRAAARDRHRQRDQPPARPRDLAAA